MVLFNALAGESLAMAFPSALCIFSLLALVQAQSESQQPKIQLRLAGNKRKHYEGRLEVFYNNEWGTICDDDFSILAAQVACRELGFLGAVSWSPSAKFGQGEGRQEFWLCIISFCSIERATMCIYSWNLLLIHHVLVISGNWYQTDSQKSMETKFKVKSRHNLISLSIYHRNMMICLNKSVQRL